MTDLRAPLWYRECYGDTQATQLQWEAQRTPARDAKDSNSEGSSPDEDTGTGSVAHSGAALWEHHRDYRTGPFKQQKPPVDTPLNNNAKRARTVEHKLNVAMSDIEAILNDLTPLQARRVMRRITIKYK